MTEAVGQLLFHELIVIQMQIPVAFEVGESSAGLEDSKPLGSFVPKSAILSARENAEKRPFPVQLHILLTQIVITNSIDGA